MWVFIIEGIVALWDLETVALAAAIFLHLNMSYLSKFCYTFEVIQKLIMELDASELSRKAQSLKTKMHQWVEKTNMFKTLMAPHSWT